MDADRIVEQANLDIQYTTGISFPTPNIYYSTGGSPPFIPDSNSKTNTNEPYLDWVTFLLGQKTIPQTVRASCLRLMEFVLTCGRTDYHQLRRRGADRPPRLRYPRLQPLRPAWFSWGHPAIRER